MTLMERKYKKNLRDDAKFRRVVRELIEETLCFLGALAWMGFLMYLFLEAVFE